MPVAWNQALLYGAFTFRRWRAVPRNGLTRNPFMLLQFFIFYFFPEICYCIQIVLYIFFNLRFKDKAIKILGEYWGMFKMLMSSSRLTTQLYEVVSCLEGQRVMSRTSKFGWTGPLAHINFFILFDLVGLTRSRFT